MLTEREILLTPAGFKKVQAELEHLLTVQRKEVADRIRETKQYGDVSELGGCAEYEEAKSEQAMVEGRILELKAILSNSRVLDESDTPDGQVGIGSLVTVEDLSSNHSFDFEIVDPIAADPEEFKISYVSPVGEALVGHAVGDVVNVHVPVGLRSYKITAIGK